MHDELELHESEVKTVQYRCPECRMAYRVAVLPHSPTIAKHYCRQCGRTNSIETRQTFEDSIADHVGEGKDRNMILDKLKRTSVVVGGSQRFLGTHGKE